MGEALNDYTAIQTAVQHYLDGGREGSSAKMRLAFHESATIYGYLGPDLIAGSIEGLYDWIDHNPAASGLEAFIASIDIHGSIASVRVETHNWGGHRFSDILNLVLIEGEWKVVCKLFHLHA